MPRPPALAIALGIVVVAGAAGIAALGMIGGAGCAAEETVRAADGSWRIERRSCGATVADGWRLVLRGTDGQERLAFESLGHPEPVDAAVAGTVLRIRMAGSDAPAEVAIDAQRRPRAVLNLYRGEARR